MLNLRKKKKKYNSQKFLYIYFCAFSRKNK